MDMLTSACCFRRRHTNKDEVRVSCANKGIFIHFYTVAYLSLVRRWAYAAVNGEREERWTACLNYGERSITSDKSTFKNECSKRASEQSV